MVVAGPLAMRWSGLRFEVISGKARGSGRGVDQRVPDLIHGLGVFNAPRTDTFRVRRRLEVAVPREA